MAALVGPPFLKAVHWWTHVCWGPLEYHRDVCSGRVCLAHLPWPLVIYGWLSRSLWLSQVIKAACILDSQGGRVGPDRNQAWDKCLQNRAPLGKSRPPRPKWVWAFTWMGVGGQERLLE